MRYFPVIVLCTVAAVSAVSALPQNPSSAPPAQSAAAQSAASKPSTSPQVIHTETRTVRVDAVVTDKQGHYVGNLTAGDFKVLEDNHERSITTFARASDPTPAGAPLQRHYIVLFFDNSSMSAGDQLQARKAAESFVAKTASPEHMIAVAEFGGGLKITQNFTSVPSRLTRAVNKFSATATTPAPSISDDAPDANVAPPVVWGSGLNNSEGDFAARTLLLALRDISNSLASISGRKTLVLFTSGFPITPDRMDELSATISAANRADVAIYPLDVRGLATGARVFPSQWPAQLNSRRDSSFQVANVPADYRVSRSSHSSSDSHFSPAAYHPGSAHLLTAAYSPFQRGGGGGRGGGSGGGGGGHGGGTGGTGGGSKGGTGGTGTTGVRSYSAPVNVQPAMLVPTIPPNVSTNQQALYMLASGTGGFPILDTNDLVGGMDRVINELNAYYVLGYVPVGDPTSGACHTIGVKVGIPHVNVRSRTGYCDVKSKDVLAGAPEGAALEAQARAITSGSVSALGSLSPAAQAPFFYASAGVARVALAAQLPPDALHSLAAEKGKNPSVDVLGIATRPDGTIAARFSDSVSLQRDDLDSLKKKPFIYQNSFDVAPGQYQLKLVFGSGSSQFAAWQQPLAIPAYNGKTMAVSSLAMGDDVQPISAASATLNAELVEDRKTLTALGFVLNPSPLLHFDRRNPLGFYAEIYDPGLSQTPPSKVAMIYVVVDESTGKQAYNSGGLAVTPFLIAGSPVVPVLFRLPAGKLPPGKYRLDVQAANDKNQHTSVASAHFVLN